jgi:pyruvate/2-oxoacid:ferredoxin oxidoreductase alpha subunit
MELRARMERAMRQAVGVAAEADEQYGQLFGRRYGLVETYRREDAKTILVTAGTAAGTARAVIDEYRAAGAPVGLARIRLFRPFPAAELRRVLAGAERVVVFDRNISFGSGGIMASELRAAFCDQAQPPIHSYVGGLGGRDVTPATLRAALDHALAQVGTPGGMFWVGLKE